MAGYSNNAIRPMTIAHERCLNVHVAPNGIPHTRFVAHHMLTLHEVSKYIFGEFLHRPQIIKPIPGIVYMTCCKEVREHLFDSPQVQWPITLPRSALTNDIMMKTGFTRFSHHSSVVLLCADAFSSAFIKSL